ncbi:MAG: hypothetical protein COV74_01505 [Candidatus Omnitrophica bacterium CG11_big_fil_rev_8_21_14_0_20_45_26]|uniref:Alkaline shock response membrane anchor protein AmaP n=1 Tax=Candidatus Abzuiibacterium crystallinum TaxID=1974748 RepID=A0A2H0LUQ8_9BACT|nr:MAG: hypothetical protein COV74_01505 [Candidatus Omnitrophica bacterium CG11_big_fil_rev_8_21_14_0_20_45_26]PIW64974.1 MAG: hypothetical protein COW12_03785 [Candidatus Omnitrophica bacterium CG12_big_fil_rev_8_21_14_0_65_45_16]
MKFLNFLIDIVGVFTFLTIGSLMLIVAFQILPMEDALIKLQMIYEVGFERIRFALTGIFLILLGLSLARVLIKKSKAEDDFFAVDGDVGRITVTFSTINQLSQKVLKSFDYIRHPVLTSRYLNGLLKVEIKAPMVVGQDLEKVRKQIEAEISQRIKKVLKCELPIEVRLKFSGLATPD